MPAISNAAAATFPFGPEMEGVESGTSSSSSSSSRQSLLRSEARGRAFVLKKKAVRAVVPPTPRAGDLDVAAIAKLWGALSGRFKNLRALALVLHLRLGHVFSLRIRNSKPVGSLTNPRLQHSFILATDNRPTLGGPDMAAIAIDPYFRQQFVIGLHDPEYSSFLDSEVPEVFVGSLSLMHSMLEVICAMMHEALGRLGVGTPPWRQPAAVMSKWFPERMVDEVVGPHLADIVTAAAGGIAQQDKDAGAKASSSLKNLVERNSKVQRGPTEPDGRNGPKVVVIGFDLALAGRPQGEQHSAAGLPLGNSASMDHRARSPLPASDDVVTAAAAVKSLSEPGHSWMRPQTAC